MHYDSLGRMIEYDTTISTRFMYDGDEVAVEIDNPNSNVLRRYVRGDDPDELLVWYERSGTTDRRFLSTDERGSIISMTGSSGTLLGINRYDEYGQPAATNLGRFQYTGQPWLGETSAYNYKARVYSPSLGRFLQTDPIGYEDSPNLYAYVLNDPVNLADPLGLQQDLGCTNGCPIYVTAPEIPKLGGMAFFSVNGGLSRERDEREIVITASRLRQRRVPVRCTSNAANVVAARSVLEKAALGADIATVGLATGGVTGVAAFGTKGLGILFEAALFGVNAYDARMNGNFAPLAEQVTSIGARLIPGGRALQSGLIGVRGPTGILRNSRGRFRASYLKNAGVKEAGNLATQKFAGAVVKAAVCGR